ncbi:MAG: 4-(cytidine 5'-diphospho)-2-C-methyl-D-erythritol kinase [Cyclobacteriaceae bacterium]
MVVFPQAKINLGLHVLFRREDGFHEIETCFYPIALSDVLEAVPAGQFHFSQTGLTVPGSQEDNLCVKAFNILHKKYGIDPVHIHLHKIIPMGAGLGGGSSDGAWMLKLLNSVFSLNIEDEKLRLFAAELGSDCPFFIDPLPAIGSGTGTTLEPTDLRLTGTYIRIIHPNIHISTAEAYASLTPVRERQSIQSILDLPPNQWEERLVNDFCSSVYERYPEIARIEDELYDQGAFYASMSGSGSAVFGLFTTEPPDINDVRFTWTGKLA